MAKLDIGAAALSGFGVIGRNPIAPAVWGLVRTLLVVGPVLLMLPTMMQMFATILPATAAGNDPDLSEIIALQSQMGLISPLSWVAGLAAYGLVTGAIFRAVLDPEDKAWFYMRIGMAEVMLVVIAIVFSILMVMAIVVGAIVVAIAGVAVGQANEGAGFAVAAVACLALLVAAIWAGLRYSMAWGLSFEKKAFLLFESWPLTRGHAGGLFLMALLNFIILILIEMVIGGVMIAIAIGALRAGGGLDLDQLEDASFYTVENLAPLIPWVVGVLVLSGVVSGYLLAIVTAPWAAAYKALRPEAEDFA